MYRVLYDAPDGVRNYTLHAMDYATAVKAESDFKSRYLNRDGTGKPFPNGRGTYPYSNPRIVPIK